MVFYPSTLASASCPSQYYDSILGNNEPIIAYYGLSKNPLLL